MMYGVADAMETHLTNEAENGRLLKLMIKLGCINERPEYVEWSSLLTPLGLVKGVESSFELVPVQVYKIV